MPARKHGTILVATSETPQGTWYTVLGKTVLLDFFIERSGRRQSQPERFRAREAESNATDRE